MITAILKNSVEEDLKKIKKCKIHILMLQEKNNELCQQNNAEIERLDKIIEARLLQAEESLKQSMERKIETSAGWVAFRAMPDSWKYDEPVLLDWVKNTGLPYYHTVEILEKMNLKKAIQDGTIKIEEVKGLKVTSQEPKFNYKLNAGGVL